MYLLMDNILCPILNINKTESCTVFSSGGAFGGLPCSRCRDRHGVAAHRGILSTRRLIADINRVNSGITSLWATVYGISRNILVPTDIITCALQSMHCMCMFMYAMHVPGPYWMDAMHAMHAPETYGWRGGWMVASDAIPTEQKNCCSYTVDRYNFFVHNNVLFPDVYFLVQIVLQTKKPLLLIK